MVERLGPVSMRILLITPGGVDRSGRERVIPVLLALIQRLARRHQVLVVALGQEPQPCCYALGGARVVNLVMDAGPLPGVGWLVRWRRFKQALGVHGGNYDVVHAFFIGGPSQLALMAGHLLGAPVVVSVGGGELVRLPQIPYGGGCGLAGRLQATLAIKGAQAITVGSRYAMEPLRSRRPDARWVPLGINFRQFYSSATRPAGPPWRLLHVASINRVKDQGTLLKALRLVMDAGGLTPSLSMVHLDLVGEDTLGGRLQQLAADLGIAGAVRLHGFRPVDEIIPLYHQAHLYVQSSLHESQGVALCEAAAAGVPTVSTAVGLAAELAPDAAWVVPRGNAPALAEGIISLLTDRERRERLGRTAQVWAEAHDADWTARVFQEIYASLTHKPKR